MVQLSGIALEKPPVVGPPVMRWSSRTNSLAGIEAALARIWASTQLTTPGEDGAPERHVAARTSVLNLVVIARQPELGERAGSIIRMLTGRHPSRTLIVSSADPDGPSWLDANVQALCMMPRAGAAETCAEFIDLVAGGETGRHVAAIVAPLLVHDLPVTLWWPGDPPLASRQAIDLLEMSDRLVVDGSAWSGDGLDRLGVLAGIVVSRNLGDGHVAVSDFAMLRQSRWREAIASSFDRPELQPFLGDLRSIVVRYAAHAGAGSGGTNLVKPLYHVAWLASRLEMVVVEPLREIVPGASTVAGTVAGTVGGAVIGAVIGAGAGGVSDAADLGPPWMGVLRQGRRRVPVQLVPVDSPMPAGTTLAVELTARRRSIDLEVAVTAEADAVIVRASLDDLVLPARRFMESRCG